MIKYFSIALLLFSLIDTSQAQLDRSKQPAKLNAQTFSFPDIQSFELKNGLKILFVQKISVPLVEMQLLFDAGTTREEFNVSGVSGIVSQMLFMGTSNRTGEAIVTELNRYGIAMFSSTNYEYSFISARCLSEYARQTIDLLSDVAMNSIFPPEYLSVFKMQQKNTLENQLRDPAQTASLLFYSQLYGSKHPYGRSVNGTFEAIDSLRVDDIKKFYSEYYRPNNATLMIVGDVDPQALMKIITDRFESWQRQTIPEVVKENFPVPDSLKILVLHDTAATSVHIRVGNLSIPRKSPHFASVLTMNQILGGDLISRLNMDLWAKKKITPSFRTMFGFHKDIGFCVASGSCPADSTVSTVDAILSSMKDMMQRKASEGELNFAQKALTKSYPLEFESNTQLIRKLQELVVFSLPKDIFDNYTKSIEAVTSEDITMASQLSLDPERATITIVGDANRFYDQLYKKYKTRLRVINPTPPSEEEKKE